MYIGPLSTLQQGRRSVFECALSPRFVLINIICYEFFCNESIFWNESILFEQKLVMKVLSQRRFHILNSQSDEIDEGEVIFSHEAIIRQRSERIASMRIVLND